MKSLILVISMMFTIQTMAEEGVSRGMASDEVVETAMENPRRYHFEDGGNIDFGNGFFKRRFDFAGQPQVCHENNVIYAGKAKKCLIKIAKQKCVKYKTYTLMTEMVGEKIYCNGGSGREDHESDMDAFRCNRPSVAKFNRGPDVKVKIYRKKHMNGKANSGYMGYTYLTIPPCNF